MVNFKGVCRARNYAIKFVHGDIIAFPDDDCRYLPNTISNIITFFDKNTNSNAVVGYKKGINNDFISFSRKQQYIKSILDVFKSKAVYF